MWDKNFEVCSQDVQRECDILFYFRTLVETRAKNEQLT